MRPTFNCGGFALGTFDWYNPYDNNEWECLEQIISDLGMGCATEECADFMELQFCGQLRRVESLEEVAEDEILVLFRLGVSDYGPDWFDYHFVARLHGRYLHKAGSDYQIRELTEDEALNKPWIGIGYTYREPIVMFALTADLSLWDGMLDELQEVA